MRRWVMVVCLTVTIVSCEGKARGRVGRDHQHPDEDNQQHAPSTQRRVSAASRIPIHYKPPSDPHVPAPTHRSSPPHTVFPPGEVRKGMEVHVPRDYDSIEDKEVLMGHRKPFSRKRSDEDSSWDDDGDEESDGFDDSADDRLSADASRYMDRFLQHHDRHQQQQQGWRQRLEHHRSRSRDNHWQQQLQQQSASAAVARSSGQAAAPHPSPSSHKHLEGGRRGQGHQSQRGQGQDNWRQKPTSASGPKKPIPAVQASRGNSSRPVAAGRPASFFHHHLHPFHHHMMPAGLNLPPMKMHRPFDMRPWGFIEGDFHGNQDGDESSDNNNNGVWWRGANVCERREEKEESSDVIDDEGKGHHYGDIFQRLMTSVRCEATDTAYRCTTVVDFQGRRKTTIATFECCPGYQRLPSSHSAGCSAPRNVTDLMETTEQLGAHELVKALRSSGLDDDLAMGNFTIFVPSDAAFRSHFNMTGLGAAPDSPMGEDFIGSAESPGVLLVSPEVLEQAEKIKLHLAGHVVEGFARSTDMVDEMVIPTAVPDANIRINVFDTPRRVMTANCVPVTSTDNFATNGIVHVTSGVVPLAVDSILTLVRARDDLSTLAALIDQSPTLRETLEEASGHLTLLAPTNAAFVNLTSIASSRDDRSNKGRSRGGGGEGRGRKMPSAKCMDKILRHHLLPNTICSAAVPARAKTANSVQKYVTLQRVAGEQSSSRLVVDGQATIIDGDCMASNGVVHVLDHVIIPPEAADTIEVMRRGGGGKFAEILTTHEAADELNNNTNVTIFVPTDRAIAKFEEQRGTNVLSLNTSIWRYHVVPGLVTSRDLRHVSTLNTTLTGHQLTVKQYSSLPFGPHEILTTQCARLINTDQQSCGAMIHFVDKVLVPPAEDVLSLLNGSSQFDSFISLLQKSGVMDELRMQQTPYTILAPSDKEDKVKIMSALIHRLPVDLIRAFVRHHVIAGVVCCASASQSGHFLSKSRERVLDAGSSVTFSRDRLGSVLIDDEVRVKTCDVMATNGVVHKIDQFLPASIRKYCPQCEATAMSHTDKFYVSPSNQRVRYQFKTTG